ncbi:MAG TPA: TetR/AcrR family transcriptional regulator [Flavipsychrobacter sp.]
MRTRNTDKVQLVKSKAIDLLLRDGLEGFSVNKLAKECGISVATLYIYYKDKDDLIMQIGMEEVRKMSAQMLEGFDPEAKFEEGLRVQWKNRAKCVLNNPKIAQLFEQLRTSTYHEAIMDAFKNEFKEHMGRFMKNAVDRGEILAMPVEVYWSIAYAPLYNLLRFHNEGRSLAGKKFVINDKIMWQTFDLVLRALKK